MGVEWVPIAGLALIVVSIAVVAIADLEVDMGLAPPRLKASKRPKTHPDSVKYRAALTRYGDVAQALVAVFEAPAASVDRLAEEWFHFFCESLGHALTTGSIDTYRVAVWIHDEDDDKLIGIAWHLFDPNDPGNQELNIEGTIAGHVLRSKEPYYCRDRFNDPLYKSRSGRQKPYESIFAVPVGPADEPFGVITVDAQMKDGFSAADQEIVVGFASLATAGASAWWAERGNGTP